MVGHNGWISVVDLTTLQVTSSHASGCDVYDVVLAPNGYAYAFPLADQWEQIRSIRLADGQLSESGSIHEQTHVRLPLSGGYIYGA